MPSCCCMMLSAGLPDAGVADCLATYHCSGGKIQKMEFVWQPRKQ